MSVDRVDGPPAVSGDVADTVEAGAAGPLASDLLSKSAGLAAVAAGGEPLARGASGEAVRALQAGLGQVGCDPGAVDGVFGRATESAVARLQQASGLSPSGALDSATLAALDGLLAAGKTAAPAVVRPAPAGVGVPALTGAARMFDVDHGDIGGTDTEFQELADWAGGGADVTVAVLDSGVDTSHPIFQGKLAAATPWDFDAGGPLTPDAVKASHGTEVASIAAFGTDKIKILPLKSDPAIAGPSAIEDAVAYARTSGARVVNVSFFPGEKNLGDLRAAVENNPDLLFVKAAGNEGEDIDAAAPDDVEAAAARLGGPNAIVVAAATKQGALRPQSDWGPGDVDIAAQGELVVATLPGDPDQSARPRGGGLYKIDKGTSFSAPFIGNVAAKLFSICPSLTAAQAKRIILDTADAEPALEGKVASGGLVDSVQAYRCAAVLARVAAGDSADAAVAGLPGAPGDDERTAVAAEVQAILGGS
jgi:hypothetical protein